MRFTFLLIFLFAFGTAVYSQRLDSTQAIEKQRAALLSKSRLQKTIGWTMFGTGLPVIIGCTYLLANYDGNDISVNEVRTVLVASIVYTGLSVPLIIAGRKNKARALALNVTSLRTELLNKGGASHSILQPALHLVVPL